MKLSREEKSLLAGIFTVPLVSLPLYFLGISLEISLIIGIIAGIIVNLMVSKVGK